MFCDSLKKKSSQGFQHRDSTEVGQGECGEALRCCWCTRGIEQDSYRAGALCSKIFQRR